MKFLKIHYSDIINDVWRFCCEMQKINLLFEEKWLFVLTNLDSMIIRRLHRLEKECSILPISKISGPITNEKKEAVSTMVFITYIF